jgi:hypothetical protein
MASLRKEKSIFAAAFNQGDFPTIALVNEATVDLGVNFEALLAALQKFLDRDFVPVWGYPAKLIQRTLATLEPAHWPFLFIDNADQAGALGYHDLTRNGQPVSKVFVKTAIGYGESVSVTACHELAEMLIDPGAQLWAQKPDGTFVAYEMADPVEEQTYLIDGIKMSNFVYPSYFEAWHRLHSVKFDYLGKLTRPFQIAKGGYLIIYKGGQYSNVFGSESKAERFALEDRRMHRSEYRRYL